jgi:murein DD-endopeptidase MepM/ murein hydrolase activator NlpD
MTDLERQLVAAYAKREATTGKLRSLVASQTKAIARVLARAGADLANLLDRAGDEQEGVGGPLKPADGDAGLSLAALEQQETHNPALRRVLASLPLAEPLRDYHIVSGFGTRADPINGRRALHEGIDLAGARGERIVTTQAGRVIQAGRDGAYGISVVIDHGMGITTRFAHLKSVSVRVGQQVKQGKVLGVIGSTGRSTGRHLHYEVRLDGRPLDPLPFLEAARQGGKLLAG